MKKKDKKEKNFLDKIKFDFGKITLGSIILNVLFLIFGVYIYTNPYVTVKAAGIIIGVYFILFGVFAIYEFLMKSVSPLFNNKIFLAILAMILGVFTIINPFKIIKILTFTLGIYLILVALIKVLESFKLKKYGYDGWLIMLVTSIILLVFGVFVVINPMASMDIVQVTGIFIILSSILEICNLFMIYSKASDLVKMFKKVK